MNLIEAVRSGKRFKRRGEEYFGAADPTECKYFTCKVEDLLADDWEVEEATATLNRKQVEAIFDDVFNHRIFTPIFSQAGGYKSYRDIFLGKLGL